MWVIPVLSPSNEADSICLLIALFLFGVTFTWDGLVRRHLRITYLFLRTDWHARGWKAVCLGVVSLVVTLLLAWGLVASLGSLLPPCHGAGGCVALTILLLPVSSLAGALAFLLGAFYFVYWAVGALEMDGPFARTFLAPGVIYREKTLVQRVSQRLLDAHLPPIPSDVIQRAGGYMRFGIGMNALAGRYKGMEAGAVRESVIEMALGQSRQDFPQLSEPARRILVTTMVDYRRELAAQVAQVYPWKRPKQPQAL
jgi:hypothetical protein